METNPLLIDALLEQQQDLSAVERFARWHDDSRSALAANRYSKLMPAAAPGEGQQYAFDVDLDACTGCKACVAACNHQNGLDPDETWRSVGVLHGGALESPIQQTVTTACHHCVDPACANGCPVRAYEKDPDTGIVRHLDDQCIGCQYCVLKCPYDVPKYSKSRGIVRKCDMCADRLAVGEAPACAQACPTGAIAIRVVDVETVVEDSEANTFLPGAAPPDYTLPTTAYRSARPFPRNLLPADFYSMRREHSHPALAVMLVLTQLAVGAFCASFAIGTLATPALAARIAPASAILALTLGLVAMAASLFHLGRPLYAFRALLGIRTSWLSREILAINAFAGLAAVYAAAQSLAAWTGASLLPTHAVDTAGGLACAAGVGLVACSVMVYHDTRRKSWQGGRVAARFFATTVFLGTAAVLWVSTIEQTLLEGSALAKQLAAVTQSLCAVVLAAGTVKIASELAVFRHLRGIRNSHQKRAARLLTGDLRNRAMLRFTLGIFSGGLIPGLFFLVSANPQAALGAQVVLASLIFTAALAGELLERGFFFSVVDAPRMPGGQG